MTTTVIVIVQRRILKRFTRAAEGSLLVFNQVLSRLPNNSSRDPTFGSMLPRRVSPSSPLSTLPGVASVVLGSCSGGPCENAFLAKLIFRKVKCVVVRVKLRKSIQKISRCCTVAWRGTPNFSHHEQRVWILRWSPFLFKQETFLSV